MREIKFRAKVRNEDNEIEVKPVSKLTMFSKGGLYYVYCENDDYEYQLAMSDLMQFTGLLDKHSKEIYEGDIVEISGVIGEVKWEALTYRLPPNGHSIDIWSPDHIEVIGNIYENPELLT